MNKCSIKGCNGKFKARGLCENHYARFLRTGSTRDDVPIYGKWMKRSICSIPLCGRYAEGHGYCGAHYQRFVKYGDPLPDIPIVQRLGIQIGKNGRVFVMNKLHPRANKAGYVPRAYLVIEKAIGRFIATKEVVHHIDNNCTNDALENLKVMTKSEHQKYHAIERHKIQRKF